MSKSTSKVIPLTIKQFVYEYPDLARRIACRKCIGDYNAIREEVKKDSFQLMHWLDTSGVVTKTKTILHYLNQYGHEQTNK